MIRNTKGAPWQLSVAPAFKYRVKGGKKVVELYDSCHLHWRAGLIESWYYGRRSPVDPTIIWEVNGAEYQPAGVDNALRAARIRADVVSIAWGDWWCGYRAVVVTYQDGRVVTEAWDSARQTVVVS